MSLLTQLKLSGVLTATIITIFTVVNPAFHLGSFIGGIILGWSLLLLLEEVQ